MPRVHEQITRSGGTSARGYDRGVLGLPRSVSRWIELADSPVAAVAEQDRRSAGPKSPVDSPCRYRIGSTSVTFGDRRAYAGRIFELNRLRSPVSSSTRLSFTRGARIETVPDPTVSLPLPRARPLGMTSRLPSSPTSSANQPWRSPRPRSGVPPRSWQGVETGELRSRARSSLVSRPALCSPRGAASSWCGECSPFAAPSKMRSFFRVNREGTPPSSSHASTTSGYSSSGWI